VFSGGGFGPHPIWLAEREKMMDEAMRQAAARGDEELIPASRSEKDLQDEMIYRSWKSGYTTRLGECPRGTKIQGLVFWGKAKLNVWPRDEHGNLIGD
jgi:hypothetical protein